jgi:2-polyprenyl-3-methyl-5-hydroxy-6-metoxy-1,4-benzoquinol methylase
MGREKTLTLDKAGKQYWDKIWEMHDLPVETDPRETRLANYVNHRYHKYFCEVFANISTHENTLLEIGCARSVWLPYFAKEFGFRVYGIDYSQIGCQQAKWILEKEGVKGEIVCADFSSPPGSMLKTFDVVVSFGVLEHFKETAACIALFTKFLKPGGLLITIIPNLIGLNGLIQKIVNRSVFGIHVPLTVDTIVHAHEINDLHITTCDYFLFLNLGVLNIENLKGSLFHKATRLRSWINNVVWIFEKGVPLLKPNRWSSPYINCVAFKPQN